MYSAPRTFKTLEAGRGIAAMLVVAYHASIILPAAQSGSHFFTFGYSGVDFFFVLSGFLMLYAHSSDFGRPWRVGRYLWKRFARIYPIYWILMAALVGAMRLLPSATDAYKQNPLFILRCLLLLPTPLHPVLGVTWSLSFEVLFYLVIGLGILNRRIAVAVGIMWVTAVLFGSHLSTSFVWMFLTDRHILEFALGAACALAYPRLRHLPLGSLAWIGLGVYVALGMVNSYVKRDGGDLWDLSFGLCSALIVLGATIQETRARVEVPAVFTLLGCASYSIYLIHYPVLLVCERIGQFLPLNLRYVVACFVAGSAGIILHTWVEAPLNRYVNRTRPARPALSSPSPVPIKTHYGASALSVRAREVAEAVHTSN